MTEPASRPLHGFRVGVTSDRRSGDLISALERRGASVLHAPVLRIASHDHDEPVLAETRAVIAARPETVLITTGYGMRRWFEVADAAGLGAELTSVLERATVLARGPKAVGAVRAAGLTEVETSQYESTAAMVDAVLGAGAGGRGVAVQLHGYPDVEQLQRLRADGGGVLTVSPYRWVAPVGSDRLPRLLEGVVTGQIDAVTFTSAPAAEGLLRAAEDLGRYQAVLGALRGAVTAAVVGPVTGAPLVAAGIPVVQPTRFRMGALVRLVSEHLEGRTMRLRLPDSSELVLRGRAVDLSDRSVLLGPTAQVLLRAMAEAPGTVVPRATLATRLAEPSDEHAVEVAVSRLRQTLGVPDLITTVVRRGYRLNAERVTRPGSAPP